MLVLPLGQIALHVREREKKKNKRSPEQGNEGETKGSKPSKIL
jgi:hypothetical protein